MLEPGTLFRALPGHWFDAGTTVEVVTDRGAYGIVMLGLRHGAMDEELCTMDEFEPLEG